MTRKMGKQLDREIDAALKTGSRSSALQFSDADIERMFRRRGSASGDLASTILGDPAYSRRFKMRGWNTMPTMLDTADVAIRHHNELGIPTSKHAHRLRADYFAGLRTRFDKEHRRVVNEAERAHGSNGPIISGGMHEDWPDAVKDRVRFLAHGSGILAKAKALHEALSKTRSPAFR